MAIQVWLFGDVQGQNGERWREKRERLRKLLCFWGCRCRTWNVSLFSSYESHLDSSICSANGCQKTKLWAKVFLARSLVILVTVLDAAGCKISVSLKVSQQCLLAVPHQTCISKLPFFSPSSRENKISIAFSRSVYLPAVLEKVHYCHSSCIYIKKLYLTSVSSKKYQLISSCRITNRTVNSPDNLNQK